MFCSHLSAFSILAYFNVKQSFKEGFRLPIMLLIGFSDSAVCLAQMWFGLSAILPRYPLDCNSQCLLKALVSGLPTSRIIFDLFLIYVHKGHLLAPAYLLHSNCHFPTSLEGERFWQTSIVCDTFLFLLWVKV